MLSTLYSVINYLRLIKPKYVDDWLYNITKQTFLALTYSQLLFLTLSYYNNFLSNYLNYLILFYLLVSLYLAIYTTYRLKQTSVLSKALLAEDELPTVTVAIAARNEDMDLHSCLDSVLIDTYPKLEVLVYDDESQDRTADLIKQYAHDGVRFIKGGQIPEGWLAKNYAYQTLLNEASGEVVFFIGTDIRLHKNSIIQGISLMLDRQSDMVAVMPIRTKNGALASIIQPMRYWWELAVPRIFPKRPPTLSSSWFARRDKLVSIGGFKSYKKSIIPEEHLAKRFAEQGKYIFA
ncbi:glycosyltransferase, partial [Candidatus Saccharibacteria bacterium]|nr:glycosyltransferase [Candidatus Saccharibacteria bacterium]